METTIIKVSHLSGKSKMLLAFTQLRVPISTKKCNIWCSHTLPPPIPCTIFRYILLKKLFLFVNLKFSKELQFDSSTP